MRLSVSTSLLLAFALVVLASPAAAPTQPLKAVGASYMQPMYDILSNNSAAYDKSSTVGDRAAEYWGLMPLTSSFQSNRLVREVSSADDAPLQPAFEHKRAC